MAKRPGAESALAAAVVAFDEQLGEYERLAELLLRTPMGTVKHLERANQTIEEIAETERRLETTGRALAEALGQARDRQQALATQIVAHLPAVQERNEALRSVLGELQQLGEALREINAAAAAGAAVREVEERVSALADRAEALSARARDGGFEDQASQAHALHQQMLAVVRKLRTVTSKQS
ncbi:MAG TPA: hypothetical protein VHE35_13135 [Kofleriaceae bacterium]|nr:hypothetical protein [Kofleriaceae bacterium]